MAFRNSKRRRKSRRVAGIRKLGKQINRIAAVAPDVAVKLLMRSFIYPQRAVASDAAGEVLAKAEQLRIPFGKTYLQAYRWTPQAAARPVEVTVMGFRGGEINDDGPTVALFHDWEHEAGYFDNYVPGLLDKGCTVIALDAPASGLSGGKRLSLREYMNAIHVLQQNTEHWDAVVGHGMGAAALVQALAQMRGHELPKRAVVLGMNVDSKEIFERRLQSLKVDESVRGKFWEKLGTLDHLPLSNYDNAKAVARLADVEALILHDTDDARYPMSDASAIAAAWPNAKLQALEGFGHELHDTAVVRRVLPFAGAKKLVDAA